MTINELVINATKAIKAMPELCYRRTVHIYADSRDTTKAPMCIYATTPDDIASRIEYLGFNDELDYEYSICHGMGEYILTIKKGVDKA